MNTDQAAVTATGHDHRPDHAQTIMALREKAEQGAVASLILAVAAHRSGQSDIWLVDQAALLLAQVTDQDAAFTTSVLAAAAGTVSDLYRAAQMAQAGDVPGAIDFLDSLT